MSDESMDQPTPEPEPSAERATPPPPAPPTTTMTEEPPADVPKERLKRHPIRGAIWGVLAGLGIAMMLIDLAVVAFGTLAPFLCVVVGLVLGVVWAFVAPPRRR